MPLIDFEKLFLQADNLRNNAQVDQAIATYLRITQLATGPNELATLGRAFHLAGVAAKESVSQATSSYYRDALGYFAQAERVFTQLDDRVGLGALYRDWAIINDYADQKREAERYFERSLATLQPLAEPGHLGITYDKFGLHYYKQGDFSTAERYIRQGLKLLASEIDTGFFYATTLYDLARVLYKQDKLTEAVDLAEESLSWYEADHGENQYQRRIAQLHGFLSVACYQLQDSKAAKKHAQTYKKIVAAFDPLALKVLQKDLGELA